MLRGLGPELRKTAPPYAPDPPANPATCRRAQELADLPMMLPMTLDAQCVPTRYQAGNVNPCAFYLEWRAKCAISCSYETDQSLAGLSKLTVHT